MSGLERIDPTPLAPCLLRSIEGPEALEGLGPRVIVVSDVRLFREALDVSLRTENVSVLSACSFGSAVTTARTLSPDAIVLDGIGPGGLRGARALRAQLPGLAIVVILSVQDETEFLAWAEIGVHGFADQNSSAGDLILGIEHALRGEVHCSPRLTALLASQLARLSAERRDSHELDSLTPREERVLELLAQGLPNKRIAQQLDISDTTTKNHVHNILSKLGLQRRAQAAVLYFRLRGSGSSA